MDESEVLRFCQDHYRYVFRRLKPTDRWDEIISRILLYSETRGEINCLLELLKKANPYKFDKMTRL